MSLHQTIKDQIKEALRAKDAIRLETLRGLNALFLNEMLTKGMNGEHIGDDAALALVKRSVKQRKDSIEQFTKGGREDLASKERAELAILESYLPQMMSREEIRVVARARIEKMKADGQFDPKAGGLPAGQAGKITGMIMRELAGKADGADVKAVVDELAAQI